jgi:cystathionine beta-lyase
LGITHQRYDPMDPQDLARRLSSKTKLVWIEPPGSVTMEFPPARELARLCRDRGVPVALDNTWGAGLAFPGLDHADIVAHALTKYPSGGGDVLMGSIVTRDPALHERIKLAHMRLGFGVGATDAEAILRALPSMEVRYRAHDRSARELAGWLRGRREIAQLLHPAFEGSPGHAYWRDVCGDDGLAAGLFSVVFDAKVTSAQVDAFCDRLRLFKLGYSWGGPMSLVVPYDMPAMRKPGSWAKGVLVRFSIGLEAAEDLRADLEQALGALCVVGSLARTQARRGL